MIKKIFVPVDFSENSLNAAEYAAQLAKIYNSDIILFHAFDIPVSDRKVSVPIITIDEVEQKIEMTFDLLKKKLFEKTSPDIKFTYLTKKGDTETLINQLAAETRSDLIVMGIIGLSLIDELLIGSVAAAVMRSSSIPVLLIPSSAKFNQIQNIVFALDTQHLSGSVGLTLLKEIARNFHAKVLVLNIITEIREDPETNPAGVSLPSVFVNDMNYSISFNEVEDIVQGIHDFAVENQADLIAMIPHKHSLLERIFLKSSNTEKMAFKTEIPLLIIPDQV